MVTRILYIQYVAEDSELGLKSLGYFQLVSVERSLKKSATRRAGGSEAHGGRTQIFYGRRQPQYDVTSNAKQDPIT